MATLIYESADESATATLGVALAEILPDGTVVALCGTLGAGKTRLVQAMAEAVGIDRRNVLSPTFVLMQEHHGRRTLHHVDAYRLRDEDEFWALGADEHYDDQGLVLVEWADRVEGCLPRERVEVRIEVTGPNSRRFEITALGRRFASAMGELDRRFRGV
jgi:tRNA threonylcarbamoyladenosine biosynthesis protein TsaE